MLEKAERMAKVMTVGRIMALSSLLNWVGNLEACCKTMDFSMCGYCAKKCFCVKALSQMI